MRGAWCSPGAQASLVFLNWNAGPQVMLKDREDTGGGFPSGAALLLRGDRPDCPWSCGVCSAGAWRQVNGVQTFEGGDGWDSVSTDEQPGKRGSGKQPTGLVDQMVGERSARRP